MGRVFAYARVSKEDLAVENQLLEIETAGFRIEQRRVVAETISGSVAMSRRPGFTRLLEKLDADDVLVVTKLDRLGRNAIDVVTTVARLAEICVRVHLALGGVDLTSSAGKLTMGVLSSVAEFERDLLIERTQAGLKRAKAQGKKLGRRRTLSAQQEAEIRGLLDEGALSVAEIAKRMKTNRQTVYRVRDRSQASLRAPN